MADKVFKDTSELISLLISRGVDISTSDQKSFATIHLQRIGYYNLINGYKFPFLDNQPQDEDHYRPGTTVNEIYELYAFDKKLRGAFLSYVLQIETNIKSLLAHDFPMKYSHDNYMLYKNFDTNKRDSFKNISELIGSVQRTISDRSSDPSIKHYLTKYGYVPLWVLNNVLTFGVVSKFYSMMIQADRQAIAKRFHVSDEALESALFYLSKIRNFCAHGNRLFCFRSKTPYIDTPHHANMNIPPISAANNEYSYGKRDLFAAMIIFKDLLSNKDFRSLLNKTEQILNHLYGKMIVLKPDEVLEYMGFPVDWKQKLITC